MPMSKGSVTIDPATGAASGAGAAKEIFDAMEAAQDFGAVSGAALATAKQQLADIACAVAVIIDHIKMNATVSTNVSTTTVGTANGVTPGPASVPTVGTGTGSGSGTVA
ncbi:MAG: hypothetical protein GY854_02235 [Deltaproteobacteria bacterium]|nr:hypothetical protein [Deltaproteobacteria bacterium]